MHDDGARRRCASGCLCFRRPLADAGVDDRVQGRAPVRICENPCAESRPIQGAVRPKHPVPECGDDLAQTVRAALHYCPGKLISIDENSPEVLQR